MKVLNASVNEHLGYANPPSLNLLVDKMETDFVYTAKDTDHGTAYIAIKDGAVRFFHHSPHNETGYAGHVFHITMEDGTTRDIRGPWSSNPDQMEENFGIRTEDVSITDDPAVFERGGGFYSGNVTLALYLSAAPFVPDYNIESGYYGITRKA